MELHGIQCESSQISTKFEQTDYMTGSQKIISEFSVQLERIGTPNSLIMANGNTHHFRHHDTVVDDIDWLMPFNRRNQLNIWSSQMDSVQISSVE